MAVCRVSVVHASRQPFDTSAIARRSQTGNSSSTNWRTSLGMLSKDAVRGHCEREGPRLHSHIAPEQRLRGDGDKLSAMHGPGTVTTLPFRGRPAVDDSRLPPLAAENVRRRGMIACKR